MKTRVNRKDTQLNGNLDPWAVAGTLHILKFLYLVGAEVPIL
jgi:hypothetical protein